MMMGFKWYCIKIFNVKSTCSSYHWDFFFIYIKFLFTATRLNTHFSGSGEMCHFQKRSVSKCVVWFCILLCSECSYVLTRRKFWNRIRYTLT
jgi:hypothetical protein